MDVNFYEVCFDNGLDREYSMCIKGVRKPTCKEAEEFLKKDIEKFGLGQVYEVLEITEEEAYVAFDMERENEFPVFGA